MFRSLQRLSLSPPYIGRWARCVDPQQTFKKVDWANEDHCGTCTLPTPPPSRFFMSDRDILELVGCFTEVPTPSLIDEE